MTSMDIPMSLQNIRIPVIPTIPNNLPTPFPVLLAIDLQPQFKDNAGQYEKCISFISSHTKDFYIVASAFANKPGSMYEKHLGWTGCRDVDMSMLEFPFHDYVEKSGYSLNEHNKFISSEHMWKRIAAGRQHTGLPAMRYYLMGCDADACVMATAFSLWDMGLDFVILEDYIYTTAEEFSKSDILKIMKRNFGDCVQSGIPAHIEE